MKQKEDRFPKFKERFRKLQGERSNTEFADFLGMSRQTVGFYCNGDRIPDALGVAQIAQRCEVSADWLLGLSETKSRDADIQRVCKYTNLSEGAVSFLRDMGSEHDLTLTVFSEFLESEFTFEIFGKVAQSCRFGLYKYGKGIAESESEIEAYNENHFEELAKIGGRVWGAISASEMFLSDASHSFRKCAEQIRDRLVNEKVNALKGEG